MSFIPLPFGEQSPTRCPLNKGANNILWLSGKVLGMFFSFIDFCIFAL